MMNFLGSIMGKLLRVVYDLVKGIISTEPANLSYLALSIIITTIIFKLLLIPLNRSQTKNQKKMAELQPEIEKLQKKYKHDEQTMNLKLQKLYKESNYNPLAGCLPMLLQFPIIIAFYRVFQFPAKFAFTEPGLYESIAKNFFYLTDLDLPDPTMILPILAAVLTFASSWLTQKVQKEISGGNAQAEQAQGMMTSMTYFMPLMILWISRNLPAALVLYWVISYIFSLVQQLVTRPNITKTKEESS